MLKKKTMPRLRKVQIAFGIWSDENGRERYDLGEVDLAAIESKFPELMTRGLLEFRRIDKRGKVDLFEDWSVPDSLVMYGPNPFE